MIRQEGQEVEISLGYMVPWWLVRATQLESVSKKRKGKERGLPNKTPQEKQQQASKSA